MCGVSAEAGVRGFPKEHGLSLGYMLLWRHRKVRITCCAGHTGALEVRAGLEHWLAWGQRVVWGHS